MLPEIKMSTNIRKATRGARGTHRCKQTWRTVKHKK